MLPALRACFPDAFIAMLLRTYTGELVEHNPYVDKILWYDQEGRLFPVRNMRNIIREEQFDAVVVVYPTLRLAWLMFLSGIPIRVGTGYRYYSLLFNRRVYEHRKDAKRHEVEYNLNLLRTLGCESAGEPQFMIHLPDDVVQRVRRRCASAGIDLNRKIAVIHPGSGGSARDWRAEYFGRLAAQLTGELHLQVVVTGTAGETELVNQVVESSQGSAIGLAGEFSLKELAAFIKQAQLFIANSTGPLHVAAAVGTPVIGLYPQHTAMSVRRWGPWTPWKRVLVPAKPIDCRECERPGQACSCMDSIQVESVLAEARSLLDQMARVSENVS